jgi:hypothetical protein
MVLVMCQLIESILRQIFKVEKTIRPRPGADHLYDMISIPEQMSAQGRS